MIYFLDYSTFVIMDFGFIIGIYKKFNSRVLGNEVLLNKTVYYFFIYYYNS